MSQLPTKPAGLRVIAIAAMAANRVIGAGNALPWDIPEDMRWFVDSTRGKTLLMGRKTHESIGCLLPKRRTLVLTRSSEPIEGVELVHDIGTAAELAVPAGELWICGGSEVYAQTLPWWDELLLTRVKRTVEGDAFFPLCEHRMRLAEVIRDTPEFRIERHLPVAAGQA